jgi:hypothetical protein
LQNDVKKYKDKLYKLTTSKKDLRKEIDGRIKKLESIEKLNNRRNTFHRFGNNPK